MKSTSRFRGKHLNASLRNIFLLCLSTSVTGTTTCYNSLMTVSRSMDADVQNIQSSSLTEFQPVVCDEKFGLGVNICGINCRFYTHIVSSQPAIYCRRMCSSKAQVSNNSFLFRTWPQQHPPADIVPLQCLAEAAAEMNYCQSLLLRPIGNLQLLNCQQQCSDADFSNIRSTACPGSPSGYCFFNTTASLFGSSKAPPSISPASVMQLLLGFFLSWLLCLQGVW
jgi:hypothetical protein